MNKKNQPSNFSQINAYMGQTKGYVKDILIVILLLIVAAFCLISGLARAFGIIWDLLLILVGVVALFLFFIQTTHISYGKTMCKIVVAKKSWTVDELMAKMPKSYVKSAKNYFLLFVFNQIKDGHLSFYALKDGDIIEKVKEN